MTEDNETHPKGDFDSNASFTGRVKWFNNRAGYGFCTIVGEGERVNEDIFRPSFRCEGYGRAV